MRKEKQKFIKCRKQFFEGRKYIGKCDNLMPRERLTTKPFCDDCLQADWKKKRFFQHRTNPFVVLDIEL